MSLGLCAPAAVPALLRVGDRRVHRSTRLVGPGGLELEVPAPFEPGRPVEVSFTLPDGAEVLTVRAEVETTGDDAERGGERGGLRLRFIEPPRDTQALIGRYVAQRLGLPTPP